MDGLCRRGEDAPVTEKEEELRLRIESLSAERRTGGARPRASKRTDKLDAEQLAARIGATGPPSDSGPAERSARWRRALRT